MMRNSVGARPWYFWPLIAFVVGLFIGWLAIGWGIWPVTWTNAMPADLKANDQYEYLTMVAESYAANGNLPLAQQRLASFDEDKLGTALINLQEVLIDRDARRAAEVQNLIAALRLDSTRPQAGATPAQADGSAATAASRTSTLRTVCTSVLWAVLAIGAIILFAVLFTRWRQSQQYGGGPAIGGPARTSARRPGGQRTAAEIAAEEKGRWPEPAERAGSVPLRAPDRPLFDDDLTAEAPSSYAPRPPRPEMSRPSAETLEPAPTAPPPRPVSTRPVAPVESPKLAPVVPPSGPAATRRIAEFTAIYSAAEPDYDEAFDINDQVDGYMGQCGLQLNDPVGRDRDQAVALQVWLWDSSDPDTQVKVLMSEGAYRDTALRAQHTGEHEAVAVRPGAEFDLESHDLILTARVERVAYAEQEPIRGVFSELQVKLTVSRKT